MDSRSIACAIFALVLPIGWSQDLTSMSFEEFMKINVSSVNKSLVKVSRAPGAVFVISQEEIHRSGAHSLPEVLRMAPGVHVARISATAWAVGIRGFNGLYGNKLLVMIDGRTVYNALFSGVLWNENLMMLEDVERIEIIRGPGATMWGANAVSGVINVITRSARSTEGGIAAVSAGSFDPVRARLRYGQRIGELGGWRTWAQYSLQGQTESLQGASRPGLWRAGLAGARVELAPGPRDSLLFEGEINRTTSTVSQAVAVGSLPATVTNDAGSTTSYVMGRWEHTNLRGDLSVLQIYDNYDALNGGTFTANVQTLDVDFHHSIQLGERHTLMAGAGARENRIATTGTSEFSFNPAQTTYGIFNVYLQDGWAIVPDRLSLEFGTRIETFTKFGTAIEPTVRLMWTPTSKTGYWASVSRAVRTPAHTDYALRLPVALPGLPVSLLLLGNEKFRPEVLKAVEAGGRFEVSRRLGFDISLFRHWYSGLGTYQIPFIPDPATIAAALGSGAVLPLIPALTTNGMNGVNQGGEASARYEIQPSWQISGSYSSLFSATSFIGESNASNSFIIPNYTPKYQWQIRSAKDFGRTWSSDLVVRRSGGFPNHALAGFTQLDCRLAKRLGESFEFSVSGTNLLRPYQQEFVGQFLFPAGLVRRGVESGVRWSF